jgi:lysophospholipase L1-like esterase
VRYLALGDSISIDYWTAVPAGGAASQFAARLGAREAEFVNLTRDGNMSEGVLADLERSTFRPEVVTLTVGGNDLALAGRPARQILPAIVRIAEEVAFFNCPVILNTVYDPTDGDDAVGVAMGLSESLRPEFNQLNDGIRQLAADRGFLLSDLERLFRGNGAAAPQPWIHHAIEPNYTGASAIAAHWLGLLVGSGFCV